MTKKLKQNIGRVNTEYLISERPQEVAPEIIEGVIEMQMFRKEELKEIWNGLPIDYERANWAELLVPESARNMYQDNEYESEK